MTNRRTKRRYAHELYPHPDEYEVRDLATDVPYLYARAIGLSTWGTGWFDIPAVDRAGHDRIFLMIAAREMALTADALHQGLTGDEAWRWAQECACDESGEWVYERAVRYGIDPTQIKPYPCGPDPSHHDHKASTGDVMGHGLVTRIDCPEDECETCTEPVSEEQK